MHLYLILLRSKTYYNISKLIFLKINFTNTSLIKTKVILGKSLKEGRSYNILFIRIGLVFVEI